MAEGLLVNCTHDTVVRVLLPCVVPEKEADNSGRGSGEGEIPRLATMANGAGPADDQWTFQLSRRMEFAALQECGACF
jgi:hypothetical protein